MKRRFIIGISCFFIFFITFQCIAQPQYQINGNGSSLGVGCYQLTPNSAGQVGSVWNTSLINLNNPFDFTFFVNLGCNDTTGADGICFGLQPISTSTGVSGNGMGLGGVTPSLGVYIDTYQNSMPDNDPWYDHISINSNGDVNHLSTNNLAGPVPASASSMNIEDCNPNHTLRVSWNPTTMVYQVWFDGVLRLTYTGNIIANIFGGNPNVYWGFSGSTGALTNAQSFCILIVANFTATDVCQGTATQFTDISTSGTTITNWTWDFGDGSPVITGAGATFQNPTHTYATSGTFTVQETITNSGFGTSTVSAPVIVLAPPTTTATGGATVCLGQTVNLTGTVSGPSNIPISFNSSSTNNNVHIPDDSVPFGWTGTGGWFGTSNIAVTGLNAGWTFAGISLNINHSFDGDVIAYLFDPCGNSIKLISSTFGSNFTNTAFAPGASSTLSSSAAPYTGTYIPTGGAAAWTAFIAACQACGTANGTWSLRVGDEAAIDVGTIQNWTINFINPTTPTYVWAPTLNMTNSTTLTPSVSPTVTTTYTLTATNSFGCTDTAQTTVTIAPSLVVTVTPTSPFICPGQTTTLTASGATSYTWSAGATPSGGNNVTADVAPLATTTFTITGTSGPCTGTAYDTIHVAPSLPISVNSDTICFGQTATFTATGGTTYTWTAGATSTGGGGATSTPTVSTSYTVTGTTGTCFGTAVAHVTVNPIPVVGVNSPTTCAGLGATLIATGAATYTWSAGATPAGVGAASNTATINPSASTTYTVTGTSLGCSNNAVSTVTVGANITITTTPDTICFGNTAHLLATGATNYTWSTGATVTGIGTADASPTTTTTYTVNGTTGACSGSATVTALVHPTPIANFSAPTSTSIVNPLVHFTNFSTNALTYKWDFGDYIHPTNNTSTLPSPSHTYADTGTYCVKLVVTNSNCTDSMTECIQIAPEFTFYIPNAFTPNGDGRNDDFFGKGNYIKSYEMHIYDRWGELLFYSTDNNKHWDGTFNGAVMQSDVYVYVFNIFDTYGKEHKYIGSVTLVK